MPASNMIRNNACITEMNNECRSFDSYKSIMHDMMYIKCDTGQGQLIFRINGEELTLDDVVKRNLPKDIYDLLQCLYADDVELADLLSMYLSTQPSRIIKGMCNVK